MGLSGGIRQCLAAGSSPFLQEQHLPRTACAVCAVAGVTQTAEKLMTSGRPLRVPWGASRGRGAVAARTSVGGNFSRAEVTPLVLETPPSACPASERLLRRRSRLGAGLAAVGKPVTETKRHAMSVGPAVRVGDGASPDAGQQRVFALRAGAQPSRRALPCFNCRGPRLRSAKTHTLQAWPRSQARGHA